MIYLPCEESAPILRILMGSRLRQAAVFIRRFLHFVWRVIEFPFGLFWIGVCILLLIVRATWENYRAASKRRKAVFAVGLTLIAVSVIGLCLIVRG